MNYFDPYEFDPAPAHGNLQTVTRRPFICEAKLDGWREVFTRQDGELFMTGRRTSKRTTQKLNKIDWVPDLKYAFLAVPGWWNIVLDTEVYLPGGTSNDVTSILGSSKEVAWAKQKERGPLHCRVFDIIAYGNQDLRDKPFHERRDLLKSMLALCNSPFVEMVPTFHVNIFDGNSEPQWILDNAYERAIEQGFEGLVVKTLDGIYESAAWAKMKPTTTYDYVICGMDESVSETYSGWGIAALRLGLYNSKGELVELTRCSGLTEAWRSEFFDNPRAYILRTVEVTAQQQYPTGALRHPRFKKLRPDVDSTEQTFKKYNLQESV